MYYDSVRREITNAKQTIVTRSKERDL